MLLLQDENKECFFLEASRKGGEGKRKEREIQRGRESKSESEGERFWISCYVTFSCQEKQKPR